MQPAGRMIEKQLTDQPCLFSIANFETAHRIQMIKIYLIFSKQIINNAFILKHLIFRHKETSYEP